jgi:hypothetical protein
LRDLWTWHESSHSMSRHELRGSCSGRLWMER